MLKYKIQALLRGGNVLQGQVTISHVLQVLSFSDSSVIGVKCFLFINKWNSNYLTRVVDFISDFREV